MARAPRLVVSVLIGGLLAALVVTLPSNASTAAPSPRAVISRDVVFEVVNTNRTPVACTPDGEPRLLRARLVGPRAEVLGSTADRLNVMVHDASTGGWFWNLRRKPHYDYATQLARKGETSVVLDRLGYGANPLADGNDTCLGAQATMLHQVVQHLRSGKYAFAESARRAPNTSHVVLHGHGTGAAIAQLEAASFDDIHGLVVMSWVDGGASDRAREVSADQFGTCLQGKDYAAYGTRKDFRQLYFHDAAAGVRDRATKLRNPGPCGDVTSAPPTEAAAAETTGEIEAPVLLLHGSRDAMIREDAAAQQSDRYTSAESVRARTVKGAGSSLVLEKTADRTRRVVLRWLASLS